MPGSLPATVPGPVSPEEREAWYAPTVRAHYPISTQIVGTVTEAADGFHYHTREPPLGQREREALDRLRRQFRDTTIGRPRTREGAIERMEDGLPARWEGYLDRVPDLTPAGRRRLAYHLGAELRALGDLTPLALDERIQIGDTTGDRLTVHTRDFAPAVTELSAETPHLDRFLSERVSRVTVTVASFEIPVTIVRRHLLGVDTFERLYVVEEPDRLPGDNELIDAVTERLIESPPPGLRDDTGAIVDRARKLLRRRLGLRETRRLLRRGVAPIRWALSRWAPVSPPLAPEPTRDRVADLTYYVARDLVGDGPLSVPLRDPRIRSVEANQVGERVKVVPHPGSAIESTRMPTTIDLDDRDTFLGLARSLAAEGGVELSVHRPRASVTLDRPAGGETQPIHCSVSLPVDGVAEAHISVQKERAGTRSPIELVERDVLSPTLLAGVWTVAVNQGRVLFVGPADSEPAATLAAHTPFIPAQARPVGVEGAGTTLELPQETAVTIPADADGPGPDGRSTPDRLDHREALHPDVLVLPRVEDEWGFARLGTAIAAGRGVFGASRAIDRQVFAERALESGLAPYLFDAIDLVVELPSPTDSRTARGWVPVQQGPGHSEPDGSQTDTGVPPTIGWEPWLAPTAEDGETLSEPLRTGLNGPEGGNAQELQAAVERRRRYVNFLQSEEMTDRSAVMKFLADLRMDEPATIERIRGALEG